MLSGPQAQPKPTHMKSGLWGMAVGGHVQCGTVSLWEDEDVLEMEGGGDSCTAT